jgi:membrane associated rhomboid family serine protease
VFFLFPYRVKNPTTHFPFATVIIIVINIVVYIFTTDDLLRINQNVAQNYGFGGESLPFLNFFTGMFLHGSPFHVISNMIMLWIFGPAVEDRLRIPRYLAVYFAAGIAGDLLQAGVNIMSAGAAGYAIGASGCIMGIIGAYWYLFSWSTVCIAWVIWLIWIWYGVWEVAAFWVIGLYMASELLDGLLSMGAVGGIAHFCHIGGAIAGMLLCMGMKIKRDTAAISEARELQANMRDLSEVPIYALQTMLEQDPLNPTIIRALVKQALHLKYPEAIDQAMAQAGHTLIDKDPALVAYYLTSFGGNVGLYHPVCLMRLVGIMERSGNPQQALQLYQLLCKHYPTAPDVETALYRMAQCYWHVFRDAESARSCIREMMRRFPNGAMAPFARTLWDQIGQSSGFRS